MPVPNFFNMKRSTVTNDVAGLSQVAYVALLDWFDDLQDPGTDGATISTDHTFLTTPVGAGFVGLYATPKSTEANGESNGDPGALNINWTYTAFLPGDDAATQVMIESKLKNQDLILCYEDAKCPSGAVYQLGNRRVPCNLKSVKPASGKKGDGSKGWLLEFEATKRYFYSGAITMMT